MWYKIVIMYKCNAFVMCNVFNIMLFQISSELCFSKCTFSGYKMFVCGIEGKEYWNEDVTTGAQAVQFIKTKVMIIIFKI